MTLSTAMLNEVMRTEWIHAFEQDEDGDEMYCRAGEPIPPARRPRERFRLHAGGTASLGVGGADDRTVQHTAQWRVEDDHIVIHPDTATPGRGTYRIVSIAANTLRVRVT